MTDLGHLAHRSTHTTLQETPKGYLGIFVVSFAMLLLIALCAQLLTIQWRPWFPGAEGEKSLIGGVKASVYTFMSYLI